MRKRKSTALAESEQGSAKKSSEGGELKNSRPGMEKVEELPSLPGNLPPEIFEMVLGKISDLETDVSLLSVNREVAK